MSPVLPVTLLGCYFFQTMRSLLLLTTMKSNHSKKITTITSNIFPWRVDFSFKTLTINSPVFSEGFKAMWPIPISSFTYSLATSLCISQYLHPLAGVF